MTRKLLAIILCLGVMFTLLAGCGGSPIGQYEEDAPETRQTDAADETEPPDETDAPDDTDAADDADTPDETDAADDADTPDETDTADPEDAGDAEPTPTPDPGLGYAAYEPDAVVATYDGDDVTWREYYYSLNYYAGYVQYLRAMGAPFTGWDSNDLDGTRTNAELVLSSAQQDMFLYRSLEALAAREDVTLDEDDQAEVLATFEDAADNYGDGDGACTEEETAAYEEYLDGQFIDRALFDRMSGVNILSEKLFTKLYGKDGADYSDMNTLRYAEEQGLMACKHILLMTVDASTGEDLSDEEIEEKKAKADALYEQLAAVQDDPKELETLFDQLMNENSEDTGLAANPDGYQFASGVMVPVFEVTTSSLEEYGLSEPVQSDYGYHIILRLPIDPDGTFTAAGGSSAPLRISAAHEAFLDKLQSVTDQADIVWNGDFETVDIGEIFGQ